MKDSKLFHLGLKDILKGILIAILTPVVVFVQMSIDKGSLHFDYKAMGMAAVGGLVAYLVKNFLTPAKDQDSSNTPGTN